MKELKLTYACDISLERAKDTASRFHVSKFTNKYSDLLDDVEIAIVATPPATHAEIVIELLKNGIHVLCEKPLSTRFDEAKLILDACNKYNRNLCLSMIRRTSGNHRAIRNSFRGGAVFDAIGQVRSILIEDGSESGWPSKSDYYFTNEEPRHGSLLNHGVHAIDSLLWWVGPLKIDSYVDDGYGGPEADCEIVAESRFKFPCTVRVSSTRRLANRIVIEGEGGSIEASLADPDALTIVNGSTRRTKRFTISGFTRFRRWCDYFGRQMRLFLASFENPQIEYARVEDGISAMQTIQQCYDIKRPLYHNWQLET